MRIDYDQAIVESVEQLSRYEQSYRGDRRVLPRLQLLRLLKSGQARHIGQAVGLLGYSRAQLVRWWQLYRDGGLSAVVETSQWGGHRTERVSPEALSAVEAKMETGEIRTLEEGRRYLRESWGIVYESVQGVWQLFRRHGIKKKTGRPRHRNSSDVAQATFQETLETNSHRRTSLPFGHSTKDGSG